MTRPSLWFYAGISCFAFTFGLLIALSKSPVIGIVFTSVFGLGGAILAIIIPKKKGDEDQRKSLSTDYKILGKSLFFFSLFLIIGIMTVIFCRIVSTQDSSKPELVWTELDKPSSVYDALDWISVETILRKSGYSTAQIKFIYQLRRTKNEDSLGLVRQPYFSALKDQALDAISTGSYFDGSYFEFPLSHVRMPVAEVDKLK